MTGMTAVFFLGFISCVLLVLVMAVAILAIAERASPRFSAWLDTHMPEHPWWEEWE